MNRLKKFFLQMNTYRIYTHLKIFHPEHKISDLKKEVLKRRAIEDQLEERYPKIFEEARK